MRACLRLERWAIGLLMLGAAGLHAQNGADSAVYAPLRQNAALVIWWIEPTTAAQRSQLGLEKIVPSVPRVPLDQRTTSELGQGASTFGQNAGGYGQTASSYGTNASNAGTTAGNYGTSASNIGRSASDTGQTASTYGQTASTLGQSASTFGVAASDSNKVQRDSGPTALKASQQQLASSLRSTFAGLNVSVIAVPDVQVKDKLAAAQRAGTYPDIVMADGLLPMEWRTIAASAGVATLGEPLLRVVQEFSDQPLPVPPHLEAAILLRAPHPAAARAYVTWLREGEVVRAEARHTEASATVADIAVRTAAAVLNGGGVPNADAAIAEFSSAVARDAALASNAAQAGSAVALRSDVLSVAVVGDHLAIVRLRTTVGSSVAFGLTYPLVVLRRAGDSGWRVVQFSTGLDESQAEHAESLLRQYAAGAPAGEPGVVSGLQPMNGDTRAPQPELGWERGAGGALFVVEWQRIVEGSRWAATNLFFVPNEGMRSQTRVNAQFAEASGLYRWRVWTVGAGGTLQLSAWQTFTVVGR